MRTLRAALCLAAVAGLIVLVPIVDRSPDATYGGADARLLLLEAGAAIALVVVAVLDPPRPAGAIVALVAALWLVPEIAGASGVSLVARTAADGLGPLVAAALLAGLLLRLGNSDPRVHRPLQLAVGGAAIAAIARILIVDPFDQVDCWRTCEHNPLLVGDGGPGVALELLGRLVLAAGVLWTATGLLRDVSRGNVARTAAAADAPGWALLLGLVVSLFVRPAGRSPASGDEPAVMIFVLVQAAALTWPATLGWDAWQRWRLRTRLARLGDLLRGETGSETLVESLRSAVRDPGLRLAFWAPARQAYVDADGLTTAPVSPEPDERVTTITRAGQVVAAVVHARRVDGRRLERAFGPALRLGLENQQLRAAALAELDELAHSRTRVVQRGELERRRLERNLHDGAQQRVVSLALMVRLLAQRSGPGDEPALRRAEAQSRLLAEELRRVARGIYPAVLADAGLAGAVEDLAERSDDLPVVVDRLPAGRFPGVVETTAFLVVRAGIANARDGGATSATIAGLHTDGVLRVSVDDDASSPPDGVAAELADQVGALGGTLAVAGAPGRRRMEMTLPCVS